MCTLKFGKRCWRPGCDRYVASVLDFCTSMVIQTWWQIVLKTTAWLARLARFARLQLTYYILLSGFIGNPQVSLRLALQTWRKIMLLFSLATQVASFLASRRYLCGLVAKDMTAMSAILALSSGSLPRMRQTSQLSGQIAPTGQANSGIKPFRSGSLPRNQPHTCCLSCSCLVRHPESS